MGRESMSLSGGITAFEQPNGEWGALYATCDDGTRWRLFRWLGVFWAMRWRA